MRIMITDGEDSQIGRLENGSGASAASALLCHCSALTSFIGIEIADPGTGFLCTSYRSPCDHPETLFLKPQPGGGSPACLDLVLPNWH